MASLKKILFPSLRVLITVVILGWLFRQHEIEWLDWRQWTDRAWLWVGLGLFSAGLCVAFGIARWKVFLEIQGIDLTWRETSAYSMIGSFFNLFLLGAVGGDAIKMYLLVKERQVSQASAFVTVLMDRLSGLVALALVAGAIASVRYSWFASHPLTKHLFVVMLGVVFIAIIGVGVTFLMAGLGLDKTAPPFIPLRKQWGTFCEAYLLFAASWKRSLWACGLAVVVQVSYFASFAFAGLAISHSCRFWDIVSMMPVVDMMASLPISISGIGVREKVFEQIMNALTSISGVEAVRLSLLGFAFSVFWGLLGGLIFIFRKREDHFRDILKKAGEES